jgi:dephospho-CoA kinase
LAAKEWFQSTSFADLDSELKRLGNNRAATVKSDIALFLPTLSRPVFFHGATIGQIADTTPTFAESLPYPWLTPNTFNGWIVPSGSTKRLGEMEFEESLDYDFRVRSLVSMLERLEEYNAALNLRPLFYTRRREPVNDGRQIQLLPMTHPRVVIVIGYRCSGKTTFGDYLGARDGVTVFEASSVIRRVAEEAEVDISTSNRAIEFMRQQGFGVVGKRIADLIQRSDSELIVITGLRAPEEVSEIAETFASTAVIRIGADIKTRFERHLRRSRDPSVNTLADFAKLDAQQDEFGLMPISADLADEKIENEEDFASFYANVDSILKRLSVRRRPLIPSILASSASNLSRTLSALTGLAADQYHSADDVSNIASRMAGTPVGSRSILSAVAAAPFYFDTSKGVRRTKLFRLNARGLAAAAALSHGTRA